MDGSTRSVKTELKLSPLKPKKRQHLTVVQELKRTEIWYVNAESFFSDEKIFTLEAKFNPENDRLLSQHSEDVHEDMLIVYHRQ